MNDDTPIRVALAEALSPYYGALTQASIDTIIAATMRRLAATEPAEPPTVRAKPLEWEPQGDTDWGDKHCGFYVSYSPDDEPETPYHAAWGEGDSESFATLAEAKDWCQREIDAWVRQVAVGAIVEGAEQSRSASSLTESAAREPKRYVSDEESKGEYAKESLIPLEPAATEIRAASSEPTGFDHWLQWADDASSAARCFGMVSPERKSVRDAVVALRTAHEFIRVAALRPSAVPSWPKADELTDADVAAIMARLKEDRGQWNRITDRDTLLAGAQWALNRIVVSAHPSAVLEAAPELPGEPYVEDDGCISLDWQSPARDILSISIAKDGKTAFAWRTADDRHGGGTVDLHAGTFEVLTAALRASTPSPSPTGEKP